jgi:hypothetical protein
MRYAINSTRGRVWKWDCEAIMVMLKKGDCEHCGRVYRYSLWHCGFGDTSYAYCDDCGMLATINYSSEGVADFPDPSARYQEIDIQWEPLLRHCECGGRFRKGAAPRCPHCNEPLSATHAAAHMEKQAVGAPKGWCWQGNWNGVYCLAIEDPRDPGTLRQMIDPVKSTEREKKAKSRWSLLFSLGK